MYTNMHVIFNDRHVLVLIDGLALHLTIWLIQIFFIWKCRRTQAIIQCNTCTTRSNKYVGLQQSHT